MKRLESDVSTKSWMLSVEQTFSTESSFYSRFSVAPTPFLEPNPLMMAFSRFPPFNRRPSHPQSPGRISLPIGALPCATPAPEFRSVIPSLLPRPYLVPPSPPPPPSRLQEEEHKSKHVTIMLADSLYIAPSCVCSYLPSIMWNFPAKCLTQV